MTEQARAHQTEDWRDRILSDPDMILEDRDLMRALIAADAAAQGPKVTDLRGVAMERLEARLDRLEDTHRTVVAAAYDNLSGTNQVHRSVLRLLECEGLGAVLDLLAGEMADILRVDRIRLVLESAAPGPAPHEAVTVVGKGFVDDYLAPRSEGPARSVTLRPCGAVAVDAFGPGAERIRSEALLRLDLGEGRLAAMLAFGSEDPFRFAPGQGTELTVFLRCVFETLIRRHLG